MNWFGLLLGLGALGALGLGFIWVIRAERILGHLWWPYFIGAGILLVAGSVFIPDQTTSALAGVVGGSLICGATELKGQAVRAELGWFPFNGKKINPPGAVVIARWKAPHL